jgi:folate-binding protein YgfZ
MPAMNADPGLDDTIRAAGAALRETPWGPVAVDFGDWEAEYRAFREAAGLFHPPSVAQVEITGTQRAEFLNRLATNKLDHIQPGEGRETFLCDANGRIVHHVFIFAGPKSLVLHTAAGLGPSLLAHLDHYWIREDLGFHDRSDEWGEVILAGPLSAGIIERLTSSPLALRESVSADLPSPPAPLPEEPSPPAPLPKGEGSYLANYDLSWNARPLMVRRWRERGFDSFHLAADADQIGPLWRALRELGATACGMRALEAIRIEEGFPVIGLDITDKNLPQEAGRNEKAISFTKGCYLGQEIVARIDSRGAVAKVLCGVRFESSDVPAGGGELLHEGQPGGQITSAAYSPGFKASVALAYVRRPFHELGVVLDSAWGKATVVELPMRH